MNIDAEVRGLDELEKKLRNFPGLLDAEMHKTMQASIDLVKNEVTGRMPVVTGALRQSIFTQIRGRKTELTGRVFTQRVYGWPIEKGRKPGRMPPSDAIEYWVRRKLGISGDEAAQVAFLIARSIGRRGTQGQHMFEEGSEAAKRPVLNLWRGLPDRVLKKL